MKKLLFWAVLMGGASGAGMAQTPPPAERLIQRPLAANPSDPAASVAPVVYQSVFADTPTGVEKQSVDWKKANADVGQFTRGHADLLKWEASQTPPAAAQKPATPGAHQH